MKHRILYTIFIFFSITILTLIPSCQNRSEIDKKNNGNIVFEKVTNLQLDTLEHAQIIEFIPIGEDSYVLTDGIRIFKTDSTGAVVKHINKQGHGKDEYLKIEKLFSNGHNIYAWCGGSLQLYKYDMDLNHICKYQGIHHAIRKFVVSENNTAYFLLSGGFDEVIGVLSLENDNLQPYLDSYSNEDNALLLNGISGGITIFNDKIKYVKPSKMEIHDVDHSEVLAIDDKDFFVSPLYIKQENRSSEEMLQYILSNSICSGLFGDADRLWLITETGFISQNSEGTLAYNDRFLNLHKIDNDGQVVFSSMYQYPVNAVNYSIFKNVLHILFMEEESYNIKRHLL